MSEGKDAEATADQEALMLRDLYTLLSDGLPEVLHVSAASPTRSIQQAYRKQALRWHPDKNRDNPRAVEHFDLLRRVYELLSNEHLRHLYNARVEAKRARQAELDKQDAVRRRMREALERREQLNQSVRDQQRKLTEHQQAEEENLRVIRQMQEAGLFLQAVPPAASGESSAGAPEAMIRLSWRNIKYRPERRSTADPLLSDAAGAPPAPTRSPDEASLKALLSTVAPVQRVVVNPEQRKAMVFFSSWQQVQAVLDRLRLRAPVPGSQYYKFKLSLPPTAPASLSAAAASTPTTSSRSDDDGDVRMVDDDPEIPADNLDEIFSFAAADSAHFQAQDPQLQASAPFPSGLGEPAFRRHLDPEPGELDDPGNWTSLFPELRQGMDLDVYEVATMQRLQDYLGQEL